MTKKLVITLNAQSDVITLFVKKGFRVIPFKTGSIIPENLLRESSLVVYCGGTDVSPLLYRKQLQKETDDPDPKRDAWEYSMFNRCLKEGKAMFGICRGFQFLNVMLGGFLVQHDHTGVHLNDHDLFLKEDKKASLKDVPANHHQICILPTNNPNIEVDVLASYNNDPEIVSFFLKDWDVEIIASQPHPEWCPDPSNNEFVSFIFNHINKII